MSLTDTNSNCQSKGAKLFVVSLKDLLQNTDRHTSPIAMQTSSRPAFFAIRVRVKSRRVKAIKARIRKMRARTKTPWPRGFPMSACYGGRSDLLRSQSPRDDCKEYRCM